MLLLILPLVLAQPSTLLLPGEVPDLYKIGCGEKIYEVYVVGGSEPTLIIPTVDGNVVSDAKVFRDIARTLLVLLKAQSFQPRFVSRSTSASLDSLGNTLELKAGDFYILSNQLEDINAELANQVRGLGDKLKELADRARELANRIKAVADDYQTFLKAPKCEYQLDLSVFTDFYEFRKDFVGTNLRIKNLQASIPEQNLDPTVAAFIARYLSPVSESPIEELYGYAVSEESFFAGLWNVDEKIIDVLYENLLKRENVARYNKELSEPLGNYPDLKTAYFAITGENDWKRADLVARARTIYAEMVNAESEGDYERATEKAKELRGILTQILQAGKQEEEANPIPILVGVFILALLILFLWRRGKGEEESTDVDLYNI